MSTVFSDPIFSKSTLTTEDKQNSIICTLSEDGTGRFIQELVRNDSKGLVSGRMVEPSKIPSWLVPGTVLYGEVQGIPLSLTFQSVIPSRIAELREILGDKLSFSYTVVTEFE